MRVSLLMLVLLSGCAAVSGPCEHRLLYKYPPRHAYHVWTLWHRDWIYLVSINSVDPVRINTETGEVKRQEDRWGPYSFCPEEGLLWGPCAFSPDGGKMARVQLEYVRRAVPLPISPEVAGEFDARLDEARKIAAKSTLEVFEVKEDGRFVKMHEKPGPDFSNPRALPINNLQPYYLVWTSGEKPFYSLCRADALQRWDSDGDSWEPVCRVNTNNPTMLLPVRGGLALVRVRGKGELKWKYRYMVVDEIDSWRTVVALESYLPNIYAVSPNVRYVVLGTWGPGRSDHRQAPETLWLARLSDGKMVKLLYSRPGVTSAAFSPDGCRLACLTWFKSGRMDRVVRTPAYLHVIDLRRPISMLESEETLPDEDEAREIRSRYQMKTWNYEDAPVMTTDELKEFAYEFRGHSVEYRHDATAVERKHE